MKISFTASQDGRLDSCVLNELPQYDLGTTVSRTKLAEHIEREGVLLNGVVTYKPGTKIKAGDSIELTLVPATPQYTPAAYDLPLSLLYEDASIVVVNKPAGLTVHPGAGNPDKTLLNALVSYYKQQQLDVPLQRCGIVHRLDKDTSGVLIVAKSDAAHALLQRQFAERRTKKEYRALVYLPEKGAHQFRQNDEGIIEAPLARSRVNRLKMSVQEEGKEAVTHWTVLERFRLAALLSLDIKTGRTHQIRAHMEHLRSGIIGDTLYNHWVRLPAALQREVESCQRLALHAYKLTIVHPQSQQEMTFTAPLPDDFLQLSALFHRSIEEENL